MKLISLLLVFCAASLAQQQLSDQDIQLAINVGLSASSQKLWKSILKKRRVTVNGAVFGGDTVGKRVTFIGDSDRISMIVADRKRRRMPTLTPVDVRREVPLGTTEVRLEATAGGIYAANIPKWCAPGVHMILKTTIGDIQPVSESAREISRNTILPSETGIVSRNGAVVTYTPLYQSAVYDVTKGTTWFKFPAPPLGPIIIVVISADGHSKEKLIDGGVVLR